MSFKFGINNELKQVLKKIYKKDNQMYEAVLKKIEEIISRDTTTIDFYKNLKQNLKDYKRVHIMKSFVLLFKVFKEQNFILFERLDHHDNIYKKR